MGRIVKGRKDGNDVSVAVFTVENASERDFVFEHNLDLPTADTFVLVSIEFAQNVGADWVDASGIDVVGIDGNHARASFVPGVKLKPGMMFRVTLKRKDGARKRPSALIERAKLEARIFGAPPEAYSNAFYAVNAQEFENAPNVLYDVLRETEYGSGEFEPTVSRVDSVTNDAATGANRGADWRKFIFQPWTRRVCVGEMFTWEGNIWICVNADAYGTLTNSALARRCDVTLRFMGKDGAVLSVPAILDNDEKQASDWDSKLLNVASGFTKAIVRKDATSNLIKANRRFLFGTPENRTAYKVSAGGVYNAVDNQTDGFSGRGLIRLWLEVDAVNPTTDDLVNGVADAHGTSGGNADGGGAWDSENDGK